MSNRRTMTDFPRNEAGLVDEFIGTAYDVVKGVYDALPELTDLHDQIEQIPTLAVDAVEEAMVPARVEIAAGVAKAEAWAESPTSPDPLDPTSKSAKSWAAEAEQHALDANKINRVFPFVFNELQSVYDVTVISGRNDVSTAGMALWIEGAIDYNFVINSVTQFTMTDMASIPQGAAMRLLVNARFDDLGNNLVQLQEAFQEDFDEAQASREAEFQEFLENSDYEIPLLYQPGLVLSRPSQTVTYAGYVYRVDTLYIPLTTTNWSADSVKMKLVGDNKLRDELGDGTNPSNGAGQVSFYDPVAPAFLKYTSDILNQLPIHLFRHVPKNEQSKINARTSDYICTSAINELLAAMRDQYKGKLILPRGLVRVDGRVGLDYTTEAFIEIEGELGAELRNMAYTPTLILQGSPTNFIQARISKLRVSMHNPNGYTGINGPKSVLIRYSQDSEINRVTEEGAIGFGISMQNAINPKIDTCVARNHKGGMNGGTGLDGIHLSAVTNPVIVDSYGENLSDDCVSVGSFDPAWPSTNVSIDRCGGRNSNGSAIKLYRMVDGANITKPWADGTAIGGVSLYDDRSDTGSVYPRYIRNVAVSGLRAKNIFNSVGAYSRAAFNIYAQPGTQPSEFTDIRFTDSDAYNCISGAVTKVDAAATVRNLEISRFTMKDQYVAAGLNPCILVQGVKGFLKLHNNTGENLSEGLISLDNQPSTFSNSFSNALISIKNNVVRKYGSSFSTDPAIKAAAVFIRPSDKTMIVNLSGNEAYGETFDGSTANRATYQFGGDVSPLSVIDVDSCLSSTDSSKLSMTTGGAGANGLKQNAAPTTGTWLAGWVVRNSLFTGVVGTARKWECSISGTFGSLSGIVASGVVGSNLLTVSDASGFFAGIFITLAGIKYRVLEVIGNQIRVDAKLTVAVTGGTIQYAPPVFSTVVH